MFVLIRTLIYATLFIGLMLVFAPVQILSEADIGQPAMIGIPQFIGMMIGATGATVALACILTFTFVGRGTPAPFDPPSQLVTRGPYRHVRNPSYLARATLYFQSFELLGYAGLFLVVLHLFVVFY